ncbi:MAG: hypothetical protein KY433_08720 [Actinobacteria bacterium]|nr:hypothetical protein [Actinomycetota bacterium]
MAGRPMGAANQAIPAPDEPNTIAEADMSEEAPSLEKQDQPRPRGPLSGNGEVPDDPALRAQAAALVLDARRTIG